MHSKALRPAYARTASPGLMIRRFLAVMALTLAAFTAIGASPASADPGSYYLSTGQSIGVNQYLQSNGWGLVLQYDGNLVLYKHFQGNGGTQTACWATGTTHHPGPYLRKAVMQQDGNFVLYLYSGGPVEWASNTDQPEYYGMPVYIRDVGGPGASHYSLVIAPLPPTSDYTRITPRCS